MSTIRTNNIANVAGTASTDVLNVINGSAKAWVSFNGTGTVAIRAGYNVSSITDNGVGDYTVNFTNALPDANYAASGSAQWSGANSMPGFHPFVFGNGTLTPPTTGGFRFVMAGSGALAQAQDCAYVTTAVHR